MGNNWIRTTIKSVADGIYDGPHATPTKVKSGPIFLGISSLNKGRLDLSSVEHLSEQDFLRWTKRVTPQKDDIVFSYETRIGEVAIIPEGLRCCLGRRMALVRLNRKQVDPRFFLYQYLSPEFQELLVSRTIPGSTVERILLTEFPNFPIVVPPLPEQRAIARILGALDDKIELNRRMNRTLEAISQALFRSWFVDFEPVSAKREGRKPVGMDDATADLFPEHFQETDMGPIPTGWRQGKVGEEFNLTMGQSPPGITYNEDGEGLPFYQGRTDFGFRYPTRRINCTAPTRIAEHGDTLVSVRAPVGDINMANERCCIGRGVAAIRHKSGDRSFTYYMMQSLTEEFAAFEGDGTLFGAINKDGFHGIKMLVPSPEVLSAFTRIVAPMDARIEVTELQIHRLAALRDTLLPQLLSGELRLGQAEKMMEDEI